MGGGRGPVASVVLPALCGAGAERGGGRGHVVAALTLRLAVGGARALAEAGRGGGSGLVARLWSLALRGRRARWLRAVVDAVTPPPR